MSCQKGHGFFVSADHPGTVRHYKIEEWKPDVISRWYSGSET